MLKGEYNYLEIDVDDNLSGKTVKEILRKNYFLSSRLISKSKNGDILLNDRVVATNKIAYSGDKIVLKMNEKSNIQPEKGELDILYEDIDLLVINKSPNIIVHPTKNHQSGTLLNYLLYYAKEKGEIYKPHLVNRLDRDTSGLLIVAKNPYAHYELMKQMENNAVKKSYLAITKGGFKNKSGLIDYKILDSCDENGTNIIKRVVSDEGKNAETIFKVLEDNGEYALVELELISGRTHQIRVHLTEIGHPLYGDSLYGEFGLEKISRQALHAYKLDFRSPRKDIVKIESELPRDMKDLLTLF